MPGTQPRSPIQLQDPSKIIPPPHPHITSSTKKRAYFYHPAYDKRDGLLFTLYAFDAPDGGIHHGLAHDACAIIADNRHDGWLTATQHGERIEAHWDDILLPGEYWFHVPDNDGGSSILPELPYRWPVVTCFQDFEFGGLPETWSRIDLQESPVNTGSQSVYSTIIRSRDITCRISNHATGTQVAHICPEHEKEWFMSNSMPRYNSNVSLGPQNLLNDPSNLILLRSDLHTAFDDRKFVIYPKGKESDCLVVHMLEPTSDIGPLYHNLRMHPIHACGLEFLYARFAWSIFPAISGFLSNSSINKAVITIKHDGEKRIRQVEEMLDAEQLRAKASQSRSRSPKKRQRAPDQSGLDEADDQFGKKRLRRSFTPSTRYSRVDKDKDPETSTISSTTLETNILPSDTMDLTDIKERFLIEHRPSGYIPCSNAFEGTNDPVEILQRLGVEIRDDSDIEEEI